MKKTVLVIDDDVKLCGLLSDYLGQYGFGVLVANHPQEGLETLLRQSPDLVILDIMLPDQNGFEVCRAIRQKHKTPIIMLTARGEVTDRVLGLELGADDYLAKPFEPRELVARIQSVLRRTDSVVVKKDLFFGALKIDLARRVARLDGVDIKLKTSEFEVLLLLAQNAGRVLSRDAILLKLKGLENDVFNRSVDIAISRLRQKLNDDPQNPAFIKTVWGTGYIFIGEESENDL